MNTSIHDAPQHGPRPLPLFLALIDAIAANDQELRARAFEGLRRYQAADRGTARDPAPIAASAQRSMLRSMGGSGPPLILIPSLINPPHVLDLGSGNSLAAFLANKGSHSVYLVDWGEPKPADRNVTLSDHVESILLPLIASLNEPPALVGYCLGGTLAMAASALTKVRSLSTIAAPWHFAGYGEERRRAMIRHFEDGLPVAEQLGLFPMEWIQAGFWSLDPERTVKKFARLADLPENSSDLAAFVALEDWANAGPPLPLETARDFARALLAEDLPGTNSWMVGGKAIDPATLPCPQLHFVSTSDRIVPADTAPTTGEVHRSSLGHVGMVVGGRAREVLWQPLSDWISRA